MPFTSFCELPLTFVPAVVLVYHPSLEDEMSFIDTVLLFNMANYTFKEYADMMLLYGEARDNGRAAHKLYEERFPHCKTPLHAVFAEVYQWASETCRLTGSRSDWCSTAAPYPRVGRGCTPCSGRGCNDE